MQRLDPMQPAGISICFTPAQILLHGIGSGHNPKAGRRRSHDESPIKPNANTIRTELPMNWPEANTETGVRCLRVILSTASCIRTVLHHPRTAHPFRRDPAIHTDARTHAREPLRCIELLCDPAVLRLSLISCCCPTACPEWIAYHSCAVFAVGAPWASRYPQPAIFALKFWVLFTLK